MAQCKQLPSVTHVYSAAVQIPVAEGAQKTFAGIEKDWVADFVHGDDGFGNMNFSDVKVQH